MNFMPKGAAMRKTSAPILPMPSWPSVLPISPSPMKSTRFAQPGGPCRVSLSLISSFCESARMKVMTDDGDGAAHAVRRDDGRDAVLAAGGEIDVVVADAEARDRGEPFARRD